MAELDSLDARRSRTAAIAKEQGLDGLLTTSPAGVAYLTGIDPRPLTTAPAAHLSADGSVTLHASAADREAITAAGATGDISYWEHTPGVPNSTRALHELWNRVGAAGAEGRPLASIAPSQSMTAGERVLMEATRNKDEDEIAKLRKAADLADIAYTATVDRVHPELRAYEIARNVERSLRAAGGGGSWSLSESAHDLASTVAYPQSGIVGLLDRHPENGVLDPSVPLPFHLLPLFDSYTGAAGTTAVFSRPDRTTREVASRLSGGLHAVLDALSSGVSGGSLHETFTAELAGLDATLVGFNVGTGPGEVVVSPGSTAVTADHSALTLRAVARGTGSTPGIVFQTTTLVTASGAERLDVVVPLRLIELY